MSETLPTVSKVLPPWVAPKDAKDVVASPFPQHKHIAPKQGTPNAILKCPVCGYEYNHLTAVEVRGRIGPLAGVGTRIDAAGTSVFHSPVRHCSAVDLEFSGECGHKFIYTLELYKGQIFVSLREMPKRRHPDSHEETIADDGGW